MCRVVRGVRGKDIGYITRRQCEDKRAIIHPGVGPGGGGGVRVVG